MKYRKPLQAAILAALLIVAVYTIGSSLMRGTDAPPKVGDRAPGFELPDLQGETVHLDHYKNQTVVLNFWGSFCEPCVDEMPLLQDFYEKYKDRGVVVLGVNLNEPPLKVKRFVEQVGVHFPILLDNRKVQKMYGVSGYPTTFVIEGGRIAWKKVGQILTLNELEDIL